MRYLYVSRRLQVARINKNDKQHTKISEPLLNWRVQWCRRRLSEKQMSHIFLLIMKYFFFLAIALSLCLTLPVVAQETPQPIPPFVQERKSHEWYQHQLSLWEAETKNHPTNGDAWYNRFKAQRYVFFGDTTTTQEVRNTTMDKLIAAMGKAIPNSWEYHLVVWRNGGNRTEFLPHLEKAYSLNPNHPDIVDEMATYNEIAMKRDKRDEFAKKWYNLKAMSPALLAYAYNVLITLEKNAILVTCGDNDTYPFWLLQAAKNIRPDVVIMNTSLISHADYRPKFMEYYTIKGDVSLMSDEHFAKEGYEKSLQEFIRSVAIANPQHPLYISITVDPSVGELIKDDLYLIGLANKYSPKRLDNIALLKRNWEIMHLDYLSQRFYDEDYAFNRSLLPDLNMNYIPGAALLYEHYMLSGESTKAQQLKEFALNIARAAGQEKDAEEYFANRDGKQQNDGSEASTTTVNNAVNTAGNTTSESDKNALLLLMPNPASTTLTLKLNGVSSADVRISDLQGKTIFTLRMDTPEQNIDISGWQSGNYSLSATTPQGNYTTLFSISK